MGLKLFSWLGYVSHDQYFHKSVIMWIPYICIQGHLPTHVQVKTVSITAGYPIIYELLRPEFIYIIH